MTDLLLALGSFAGLIVYATVAVAVYRFADDRTSSVYQRIGTALAAVVLFTTGIILTAVLIQWHGKHADRAWICIPLLIGGALWGVPFVNAVGYELFDGNFGRAILWPLAVPLALVIRCTLAVVVFASRGPLSWGSAVADALKGHEEHKRKRAVLLAQREDRIVAKEKELGIE